MSSSTQLPTLRPRGMLEPKPKAPAERGSHSPIVYALYFRDRNPATDTTWPPAKFWEGEELCWWSDTKKGRNELRVWLDTIRSRLNGGAGGRTINCHEEGYKSYLTRRTLTKHFNAVEGFDKEGPILYWVERRRRTEMETAEAEAEKYYDSEGEDVDGKGETDDGVQAA